MPNPPYSGVVIIIRENQDGLSMKAYANVEVPDGTPVPAAIIGIESALFGGLDRAKNPPDVYEERQMPTRTGMKTVVNETLDTIFSDTPE